MLLITLVRGQEYQKAVTLEVLNLCRIIYNHVRTNNNILTTD